MATSVVISTTMNDSNPELAALLEAIQISGSQYALADAIGVSATAVWKMVNRAKRASSDFVLKVEAATGVSRHDLRPDLYPRENTPGETGPKDPTEGLAA